MNSEDSAGHWTTFQGLLKKWNLNEQKSAEGQPTAYVYVMYRILGADSVRVLYIVYSVGKCQDCHCQTVA